MGLRHMIISEGGLAALENNQRMQLLVVFISSSCNANYLPDGTLSVHSAAGTDIIEHIAEFKTFFQNLRKAASYLTTGIKLSASSGSFAVSFVHNRPIQHFLLKKDGPLHRLLAPSENDGHRGGGGLGLLGTHRLACLFYLSSTLLSFENEDGSSNTEASERYLRQLHSTFLDHKLDRRPNIRLFLFVLIRGPLEEGKGKIRLENAERSWSLVRMMQVAKCLRPETTRRVGRTLLNFLMMVDESKGSGKQGALNIDGADLSTIDNEVWAYLLRGL